MVKGSNNSQGKLSEQALRYLIKCILRCDKYIQLEVCDDWVCNLAAQGKLSEDELRVLFILISAKKKELCG